MNYFQSHSYQNEFSKQFNKNYKDASNQQKGNLEYRSPIYQNKLILSQKLESNTSESSTIIPHKTKTLVLDLDETLIHSTPFPINKYDTIKTVF